MIFSTPIRTFGICAAALIATSALGQAPTNFAGTYRCEAEEMRCAASGMTFTVMQNGSMLSVANDKNETGSGTVTSAITISMGPPWNMLGVVHEANAIEWSNGTRWRKQ